MPHLINFLLDHKDTSRIIYCSTTKNITVKELQENVYQYAHGLLEKNVKAGDCVVIKANDSLELIYTFWALLLIGAKIIILLKNLNEEKTQLIFKKHNIQYVVSDGRENTNITVLNIQHLKSNNTQIIEPCYLNEDDPVLHFSTSGTNGGFKLIVHSNKSLVACFTGLTHHYCNVSNGKIDDFVFCPASIGFSFGCLINLLGPIGVGYKSLIGIQFIHLKNFTHFINQYSINHLVLTPYVINFINKNITSCPLPTIKSVTSGGETLYSDEVDMFKQKFNADIHNLYGLGETFTVASERVPHKKNSVGQVQPHVKVRIVDDTGNECAINDIGVIQVNTPSQFIGYLDDVESTNDVIRDGWVHTNDVGYFDKQNNLILLGRANSCFKTHNKWVSLLDIEDSILQISGIKDCLVVNASPVELEPVIFALIVTDSISDQTVREWLMHKFKKEYMIPKKIMFVDELPKTANMKKIRNYSVINKQIDIDVDS